MAKDSIYQRIVDSGISDANVILSNYKEKALKEKEDIINKMNNNILNMKNDALAKMDNERKAHETTLQQKYKQDILSHKKQLIHKLFNETIDILNKMSIDDFSKYVIKCITNNTIDKESVIVCNKDTYNMFISLYSTNNTNIDKLNDIINVIKNDSNYHLTISNEYININGGFIINGSCFDIDCSYESMLKELESEMEKELEQVLFSKE